MDVDTFSAKQARTIQPAAEANAWFGAPDPTSRLEPPRRTTRHTIYRAEDIRKRSIRGKRSNQDSATRLH